MDIIRRIRDCIAQSQYTQKELSEKLGISEDSMVRYLKGKSQFKLDTIIKLSEILQISTCYLITGKEINDLTQEEQQLLEAYRNAEPDMRKAARKMLDAPELPGKSSTLEIGEKAI